MAEPYEAPLIPATMRYAVSAEVPDNFLQQDQARKSLLRVTYGRMPAMSVSTTASANAFGGPKGNLTCVS